MTREQAEDRILEKAREILEIINEYYPDWSDYITIDYSSPHYISIRISGVEGVEEWQNH